VIALSGDGSFAMLMGDFRSLAQLKLPLKVVVFNNNALGFIELEQKSTGFLDFGRNSPTRAPLVTAERQSY
jgi:TPP-dependent trihydroxycyclohexane-1,2-dione (THcHDO) dehydratase